MTVEIAEELEKAASGLRGVIGMNIAGYLFVHIKQNQLGHVFNSSTNFRNV